MTEPKRQVRKKHMIRKGILFLEQDRKEKEYQKRIKRRKPKKEA